MGSALMRSDAERLIVSTQDNVVLLRSDSNPKRTSIALSRDTAEACIVPEDPQGFNSLANSIVGYGILGAIRLLAGFYLLIITGRKNVYIVDNCTIWKITQIRVVPLGRREQLNEKEVEDEMQYRSMVSRLMDSESFYYADGFDLTSSTQRRSSYNTETAATTADSIWTRVDLRFAFNRYLAQFFLDRHLEGPLAPFLVPVMQGYVAARRVQIGSMPADVLLISRRSVKGAGARYERRGVDYSGSAANFVETEQILVQGSSVSSFVQIRGSMPCLWSQRVNLVYKPKPVLHQDSIGQFRLHFEEQKSIYSTVSCVNLVNSGGSEAVLWNAYEDHCRRLDDPLVRYYPFNLNQRAGYSRLQVLDMLMEQLTPDLGKYGLFHSSVGGFVSTGAAVAKRQSGVFRTSCVDSLDRTNIVQTCLGKAALLIQLAQIQSSDQRAPTQNTSINDIWESGLKYFWADNGDTIAQQYAGSGAMRSDMVRKGKATFMGLLRDGANALERYYVNNFFDGEKQDGYSLVLGDFVVDRSKPSPLQRDRILRPITQLRPPKNASSFDADSDRDQNEPLLEERRNKGKGSTGGGGGGNIFRRAWNFFQSSVTNLLIMFIHMFAPAPPPNGEGWPFTRVLGACIVTFVVVVSWRVFFLDGARIVRRPKLLVDCTERDVGNEWEGKDSGREEGRDDGSV